MRTRPTVLAVPAGAHPADSVSRLVRTVADATIEYEHAANAPRGRTVDATDGLSNTHSVRSPAVERAEGPGGVLEWRRTGDGRAARLVVAPTAAPRTELEVRVDADARLAIGLVTPVRRRPVDVTIQPALVARVACAGRMGEWAAEPVARWVTALCTSHDDVWHGAPPDDVTAALGGAAFPVLGAAYERGAATANDVPRWSVTAIRARHARDAATALVGRAKATRPVVAAVGQALVDRAERAHEVALFPFALATIGAPVLEPDQLARLVVEPAHPHEPTSDWPDEETVARLRRGVVRFGARCTERVLGDAARLDDGPQLLARLARLLRTSAFGDDRERRRRLPNRLAELVAFGEATLPIDPAPAPRRTPPAALQQREDAEVRAAALRPPATAAASAPAPRVTGGTPIPAPPAVAALHRNPVGAHDADLRLAIPRTVAELYLWGTRLRSCIGDYGPAAVAGTSTLIGVERDDRLTYCVELTPDRRIRQFLGEGNRAVPHDDRTAVVAHLVARGLVDASNPANAPWTRSS